jgi:hypothetical protein
MQHWDIKILKITGILVRKQNFEKQKSGIPKYQNRTYFFWNPWNMSQKVSFQGKFVIFANMTFSSGGQSLFYFLTTHETW